MLDGDNIRHGLNRDLGFTADDRTENIRRIAEVAAPDERGRRHRDHRLHLAVPRGPRAAPAPSSARPSFLEVYVDAPLAVCEERDPKGLYRKARAGEIPQFTGDLAPYEAPQAPQVRLETAVMTPEQSAKRVVEALRERHVLR